MNFNLNNNFFSTPSVKRSNYIAPGKVRNFDPSVLYSSPVLEKHSFKKVFWVVFPVLFILSVLFTLSGAFGSYYSAEETIAAPVATVEPQSFVNKQTTNPAPLVRGTFDVEVVKPEISWVGYVDSGSFINDPFAKIQYPFGIGIKISSDFGSRTPICVDGKCNSGWHSGTDFAAEAGTPIQVIADGVVKESSCGGGYGCHVIIEHNIDGKSVQSLYGHMKEDSVVLTTGQVVKVGQLVGQVGNTGFSDGNHLHFELIVSGEKIDPMTWDKWNTR